VRRDRALALLLSATVVAVCGSIVWPPLSWAAAASAAGAALIASTRVGGAVRAVVAALALAGVGGLIAATVMTGRMPGAAAVASVNQDLVAMLAAVSLVRLVMPTARADAGRLHGWPAIVRTSLAVHLLASVINMSALTLAAHRLSREGRLPLPDAVLLSRAYAAGAFWSPFWLASAATIAVVPDADTRPALIIGAVVALVAVTLGTLDVGRLLGSSRAEYRGYPLTPSLLVVPSAMVALVMIGHVLLPDTPIPRLVTAAAVLVCIVGLARRRRWIDLARHATGGIGSVRAEAALFVAAGILTAGLSAVVAAAGPLLPLGGYDITVAWLCLVATIGLATLGLHPIVTLALSAAIVLPLDPQPSLFVLATLLGWGASATVGPTSGLLMHLTSQFGVGLRELMLRNALFVGLVAALAWPALLIVDAMD